MFVFAVFAVNHSSCELAVRMIRISMIIVNCDHNHDDDDQRVVTVKVEMVEVVATLLSAN